ncbi:hypothetical protein J4573_08675 [Actinomadura barringtoniae]|uniref:Uncharacterized protein n=1 Tax=Actinomadura barringtoniae TaxID=1427535 RepID=A0A939T2U8_9ACTN|nr:hypothetical protein [Actinomadura barringtoniae]MBO2447158.1 hypothetical protein [Actinomadura barringtoniae]
MREMTPAVERLVRLMILLPKHNHPLWKSITDDCGNYGEVTNMRWFVGDAAKMWPEGGPRNLAAAVLIGFGSPSEKTILLLGEAILRLVPIGDARPGPRAGDAWVAQATAAAVEVLAQGLSRDDVLQEAKAHWTLGQN